MNTPWMKYRNSKFTNYPLTSVPTMLQSHKNDVDMHGYKKQETTKKPHSFI